MPTTHHHSHDGHAGRFRPSSQFSSKSTRQCSAQAYDRGLVLLSEGYYEAAIASFDQALHINPQDADAWYQRGHALANLERYRQAIDSFEQALLIAPDLEEAWVYRGAMLIHLGDYETALASCDQALKLQPQDRQAWIFRGVALRYLNRYKEAYASYDAALGIQRKPWWKTLGAWVGSMIQILKSQTLKRKRSKP